VRSALTTTSNARTGVATCGHLLHGVIRSGQDLAWCAGGRGSSAAQGDELLAVVERKTLENLATSLSDASLAFQLQRLAEMARAAIVVEGDYPHLFQTQPGRGSWLADMLARLAVRYPEVPIAFAGSRKFAEEWAYRFLSAAVGDQLEPSES
jgi:hypothetical protein